MRSTPIIALLVIAFSVALAGRGSGAAPPAPLAPLAPTVVSYQGRVIVGGTFFDGPGYFKFAIVNQAGDQSYWSNDGSSAGGAEPTSPVALGVSNGLFNILLGDDSLGMVGLNAGVFKDANCYLRVWFSANAAGPFDWLKPDRRMAAVPYAFQAEEAKNADTLDGYWSGNASGNVPLSNGTLNTNLNADLLDGSHASAFQQHYANVVIVAKSGGDYATITAALNSISDADDTNRYLVKVMPGVYAERVTMKAYVDIEGSGELVTRITGTSGPYVGTGTLTGANNAELRLLTVANTGGGTWAVAIYSNYAALRLTHVTATSSGATNSYGVFNSSSATTMHGVTANASGTSTSIGVENFYGSPLMQDVSASASGGMWAYGVHNNTSLAVMQNVTATASGASTANYGVYDGASSPAMQDVTASATGGVNSYAVYNYESSPSIRNSSFSASSGTSNYGVYNDAASGSHTVRIDATQVIAASTATIYNNAYFTTRVGASLLAGGAVAGGGVITCTGAYDGNDAPLGSNCLKGRTVLVSPMGTAAQNGTALLNALAGISGATSSNAYLLKIEPGLYDVGTSPLTMRPYVDIEGSGELTTRITGTGSVSSGTGTVVGADNAELRLVTVANTGGNTYAKAIYNGSAAPRLTHVIASASGGTYSYGVYNSASSPRMQDITASASGGTEAYGVFNSNSSPLMQDLTASASGGTKSSCGVLNSTSSPTMQNVTASATGGGNFSYGVQNSSSSPAMLYVTASASGGSGGDFAVYNFESSPVIQNSILSASGGTSDYGVYNDAAAGSHTVRINNTQVTASAATIYNNANFTTRVGGSLLAGGAVAGGGTITCAGVYDENYAFSTGPACP